MAFGNKNKSAEKSHEEQLFELNVSKFHEKYNSFKAPLDGTFREYDSRNNPMNLQFISHMKKKNLVFDGLDESLVFPKPILNRFKRLMDMKNYIDLIKKSSFSLPAETATLLRNTEKEIPLIESFLVENLQLFNMPLFNNDLSYERADVFSYISEWAKFFSRWKVKLPTKKDDHEFFDPYILETTSYGIKSNEIPKMLVAFINAENVLLKEHKNERTQEFATALSTKAFYQVLLGSKTFVANAAKYFPEN